MYNISFTKPSLIFDRSIVQKTELCLNYFSGYNKKEK